MIIKTEEDMLNYGKDFAKKLLSQKSNTPIVIELTGDVGAGKTTFTRGLAKGLGVKEPITSPSFTISKSYACENGRILTHYDFYRLDEPGIMSSDLTENLTDPTQIIVVEWGDSIANLLPPSHIQIQINIKNDDSREVII